MRTAALVAAALFMLVVGVPTVSAAEPIVCPPGSEPDARGGICIITVTTPEPVSSGGSGGGATKPAAQRTCTFTLLGSSREMPCSSDDGWWSQSQQAYCEAASPQPPLSDPVWGGRMRCV